MTKQQENRLLSHGNRGLIAFLSVTGMLLDGGQGADLVLGMAVVLWLWGAELQVLELSLLHRFQSPRPRHRATPGPRTAPARRQRAVGA
jgi:hypothetical protein